MVNSRIAPNLLMVLFIVGGLMMSSRVKQEVFPEFDLDRVTISVVYPGASPEEIEQGVILVVEEAVRGVDGVKEIGSTARESVGLVTVELVEGKDAQRIYQDIQQQVDRILTFPEEIEEPQIALATRRRNVLAIQLYGNADEWVLRELAESVRDRLLQSPGITQVELSGVRDYEIAVEVPLGNLRAYGLTLDDVARIIRQSAVELPGGSIKTSGQEILLRVRDRRDWARQFAEVAVVSEPGGSVLRLGDIATVTEGFEDTDRMATYGGHPAIGILIDRVGDQTPIGVSEAAATALAELKAGLPPGIDYVISSDRSEIYRQRLDLLLKNAFIGLGLVLLLLGTFLKLRLAFWVTMGIPISFLGTVLFMPSLDVSINMISMFGFILALGIVVDDAIIAGENIYEYQQQGMDFVEAAIKGAGDITKAVSFSIITNIVAFMPLLFVPGLMGKFFRVIPVVLSPRSRYRGWRRCSSCRPTSPTRRTVVAPIASYGTWSDGRASPAERSRGSATATTSRSYRRRSDGGTSRSRSEPECWCSR